MTDSQIIESLKAGGLIADQAIRHLYNVHAQGMLRYFVHNGASSHEAKDVLQECLIRVFRNSSNYRGEGELRSWVWQIARNCLSDHQSKRQSQIDQTVDSSRWETLSETIESRPERTLEADDCVSQGLENFGRSFAERAFALTLAMEGESMDDIGLRIGRSPQAARQYLYESRHKLKPFIEHCLEHLGD